MSTQLEKAQKDFPLFGGSYIPEILAAPLQDLTEQWKKALNDNFLEEVNAELQSYGGRPTPITEVPRFARAISKKPVRIFLKREDLLHTGAHKLNNALGQCLLAKKMGKTRIIAETGAGQHGVATATACARLGLDCVVYMGTTDMARQHPNVERMRLLGAEVRGVPSGSATLKDAVNEAMRDWSASFETTHYCLGSALGPEPYPEMVRTFQTVIGLEARTQMETLPDMVVACVGGGSNAIGIFMGFLDDDVTLIGVEAGGHGIATGKHAARCATPKPGVLHGSYTYLLQDEKGQILETHSISAGLDYPAIGPEHAVLHASGRVHYTSVEDDQAVEALKLLAKTEGIIAALESSHALAFLIQEAENLPGTVLVNLSGRGDKDLPQLFKGGNDEIH